MMLYKKRKKYKYILCQNVYYKTGKFLHFKVEPSHGYVTISRDGTINVRTGYAWDGASGIAIDTENFMEASLIHDALYQLMRERHLPTSFRKWADEILRDICIERGMSRVRAWWVYLAVRLFGKGSAKRDLIRV